MNFWKGSVRSQTVAREVCRENAKTHVLLKTFAASQMTLGRISNFELRIGENEKGNNDRIYEAIDTAPSNECT